MSLLSKGDEGSSVKILQEKLSEMGYSLDVDGIFGRDTDAAVRHFQSTWGLDVDGMVGPATHSKIHHEADKGWQVDEWDVDEWAND